MNLLANLEPWAIGLIIAGGVLVVLIIIAVIAIAGWYVSTHNTFMRLKNANEEAFSTIDVYLKKRYDLIPNLVETVKGFAKHEKETLTQVISARNQAVNASTTAEKIEADANLSNAIKSINIVAEKYPQLQANANFMDLSNQLKNIETELVNARKYYNATVKTFNTKMDLFPSSIVARNMGLQKFEYFEIVNEQERENVKVKFD